MKKASESKRSDGLRPAYDLAKLKGGARGKYYDRALTGSNLVLIDPDLAVIFPDAGAVNRALRAVADAASEVKTRRRGTSLFTNLHSVPFEIAHLKETQSTTPDGPDRHASFAQLILTLGELAAKQDGMFAGLARASRGALPQCNGGEFAARQLQSRISWTRVIPIPNLGNVRYLAIEGLYPPSFRRVEI